MPAFAAEEIPAGLRAAFEEARHSARPLGDAFRFDNPENRVQAEFSGGAMLATHPEGSMGLRLVAYGYGAHPPAPGAASASAAGARVEYRRGALTEWYVNDARGVEQGFTLREAPAHADGGPLALELAVTGDLTPVLTGDSILLERNGREVLRYGGLRAWDARGQVLSARMELQGSRIRLMVGDAGAVYPITVDPWILQQTLTPSDGGNGDYFGGVVSIDGNTAVIGAFRRSIGANLNQGAAYVFTRNGTVWTQQQELTAPDGAAHDHFGVSVSLSGDTVVVSAPAKAVGANTFQGAAYVFTRSAGVWTQQALLTSSDGAASDDFGASVSLSGDTVVVGADFAATGSNTAQGAAYVFTRSGGVWTQQQKLTASDGAKSDNFGATLG